MCKPLTALALAASIVAMVPAAASELWELDWIEVHTPHFVIVSAMSKGATIDLARDLETFRSGVQIITNIERFEERIPTTVYLLPTAVEQLGFKANIAGYFIPEMRANYAAAIPAPYGGLDDVVKHEYVHFLLHNRDELNYPPWFDEGFAEFLATMTAQGNVIEFGKPSLARFYWLANQWIPYRTVLEARNVWSLGESNAKLMFYAQSWLLTHYLVLGREGFAEHNATFLRLNEAGTNPLDAFEQAFGIPVANLDSTLGKYIGPRETTGTMIKGNSHMKFRRIALKQSLPQEAVQVMPITSDAVAGHLGMLAFLVEEPDEAKRIWEAAIRLNPNNTTALSGLGDLHKRAGRFDAAKSYYEKAIAAEPQNPYPELDYAEYFLDRANAAAPADVGGYLIDARRHFTRSYKLDENNPETLAMNGSTYLFDGESAEKAVQSLGRAHQLLPSQPRIKFLLARAYEKIGDRDEAMRLLRSVVAWDVGTTAKEANELLQRLVAKQTDG